MIWKVRECSFWGFFLERRWCRLAIVIKYGTCDRNGSTGGAGCRKRGCGLISKVLESGMFGWRGRAWEGVGAWGLGDACVEVVWEEGKEPECWGWSGVYWGGQAAVWVWLGGGQEGKS